MNWITCGYQDKDIIKTSLFRFFLYFIYSFGNWRWIFTFLWLVNRVTNKYKYLICPHNLSLMHTFNSHLQVIVKVNLGSNISILIQTFYISNNKGSDWNKNYFTLAWYNENLRIYKIKCTLFSLCWLKIIFQPALLFLEFNFDILLL